MANEIYTVFGTPVTFKASGGTVAFSPASVATTAGRKSALWTVGTTPQPVEFAWRAKTAWQLTPVVGETLDIYMATSDGTIIDGLTTAGDAGFTDVNALANMLYIGSLVADMTTTDSVQASGTFRMHALQGVLVWWNAGSETLSATGTAHEFIATPIYPQGQ